MDMTKSEFDSLRRHVRQICGIELADDKEYLIRQRFEPLAEKMGCSTFGEFLLLIDSDSQGKLRDEIIAAITTNETFFFRDDTTFEMFRKHILPSLAATAEERKNRSNSRKGSKITILSAGASTGQEAYSLAMMINDRYPFPSVDSVNADDYTILGGDISQRVLAKAISGEYTDAEADRGLNEPYRSLYFYREKGGWSAKDKIRRIVQFRRVNFVEPFTFLGGFDCIFCRNMLIYFDIETKIRILEQFHQMLAPEGFLVLGATENIYGLNDKFNSVHVAGSIVYVKV